MSINYLVAPLGSEMLEWAEKCRVPVRGILGTGRPATLDELIDAVRAIPGHSHQAGRHGDGFDIMVESDRTTTFPCEGTFRNTVAPGLAEGPVTSMHIAGAVLSSGSIQWMSFHGDTVLLVAIVRQLTRACGPQAMFSDADGIPWLVLSPESVPLGPEAWCGELPEVESENADARQSPGHASA